MLPKALVAVWAALAVAGGATLMAGHWATLPRPATSNAQLASALADLHADHGGQWQVVHFLAADCRCSQRIVTHLTSKPRPHDVHETIVLVGDDDEIRQRARHQGFHTLVVSPDELKRRFGVTGAPLFAVASPGGAVRYLGGYTNRKQGADIRDTSIIASLQHDEAVTELPLFGCATSVALQEVLDPLGIKY